MVADSLIYHPTVSHYLKFVATTVGRDKLLRTLQYFSRFLAWYLYRTNHPSSTIAPFEATKKQFGITRKLMRVGKFVEHFKAAAVASEARAMDPVLKWTAVGRQLGYAGYMLLDNVAVLDAANIRKFPTATRILREAYRAWFAGLSFSIVSSLYALYKLRERAERLTASEAAASAAAASATGTDTAKAGDTPGGAEAVVERKKVEMESRAVKVQLVSDLCDITIPSAALGWVALDDGIVGLAGVGSSLLGAWGQWKKTA